MNYVCNANAATNVFAKGVSQISGVNIDYILGIFNGTINPPFLEPLECIDDELVSFYSLLQNIETNLIPQWDALAQKSPSKKLS